MGNEHRSGPPRLTHQSLKILKLLLEDFGDELPGAEVMRRTGLSSGTTYPILLRFEEAGLLQSHWEEAEPSSLGRPRRRLYSVTALGHRFAREKLQQVSLLSLKVPSSGVA